MLSLFMTHLQGYKKEALKSPILIVLEVICELLLPLVMAQIVDTAIPAGDVALIFKLGALMLVLAAASMTCGVLASKYATCGSACSTRCRSSPSRTSTASPPPPSSPA